MQDKISDVNKNIVKLTKQLQSNFSNLGRSIGNTVGDVVSSEMQETSTFIRQGASFAKDTGLSTLSFFKNTFGLNLKAWKIQKKQLKISEQALKLDKQERRSRLSAFKGGGKSLLKELLHWLGLGAFALGAGIGALIGTVLLPFRLAIKPFMKWITPLFKWLGKLVKGTPIGKLAKSFKWLSNLFKFLLKIKGISHLVRGLRFGFTKLVWPLQILLSTIDFIKGYMDTEGDLLDKIRGGIKNVIVKFLEWPALMLGTLWDWLTIDFLKVRPDEERGKAGSAIVKGIGDLIDAYFKYFDIVFKPVKDAFFWLVETLKNLDYKAGVDWIKNLKKNISEFPERLKKWFQELPGIKFLYDVYDKYFGGIPEIKKGPKEEARIKSWWEQNDKAKGLGLTPQLKLQQKTNKLLETNNNYQRQILEKETPVSPVVYPPPQKLGLPIPDRSENRDISNMTASELGLANGY